MRGRFKNVVLALAVLATGLMPPRAFGEAIDVEKAATIKAAYLLNFVRYTQWPDDAFEAPDSPIVLTAVGDCEISRVLAEVVRRSEPINGRRVALQHAPYPENDADRQEFWRSLDQSHLVFVCSVGPEPVDSIVERCGASKKLTVGDTPGFAADGGMLGFVFREGRIVFQANPKAIQKSQVTVSAKVLKLAQIVGENAP
jgi:hypothetical protein